MRPRRLPILLLLASLASPGPARGGDPPRGTLFIIGGGTRTPEMIARFVELAGGPGTASILVLPMASSTPETVGVRQAEGFRRAGAARAESMVFDRTAAALESTVRRLQGFTGVFFSGGDQSRLTAALAGTPVLERLHAMYREGAVIGGTSAGAAVMSAVMITGGESLNRDTANAFSLIRRDNVETAPGFGFIETAVIDQHFVRRKRHNRLLSVVLERPHLLGIGIDEATAVVVTRGAAFDVLGGGSVIVFDAAGARDVAADENGNLAAAEIRTHILVNGDSYDLTARQPRRRTGAHAR
jgi:cyanophycinase